MTLKLDEAALRIEACARLAEAARKAVNYEREEYFYQLMRQSIREVIIEELNELV